MYSLKVNNSTTTILVYVYIYKIEEYNIQVYIRNTQELFELDACWIRMH